jgi:hypothetical protein
VKVIPEIDRHPDDELLLEDRQRLLGERRLDQDRRRVDDLSHRDALRRRQLQPGRDQEFVPRLVRVHVILLPADRHPQRRVHRGARVRRIGVEDPLGLQADVPQLSLHAPGEQRRGEHGEDPSMSEAARCSFRGRATFSERSWHDHLRAVDTLHFRAGSPSKRSDHRLSTIILALAASPNLGVCVTGYPSP